MREERIYGYAWRRKRTKHWRFTLRRADPKVLEAYGDEQVDAVLVLHHKERRSVARDEEATP